MNNDPSTLARALVHALACWYVSGAVVAVGLLLGVENLRPGRATPDLEQSLVEASSRGDGRWYTEIAARGYRYEPGERCNVAFFPLFPHVARALSQITGAGPATSLVTVSNTATLFSLVLFALYGCHRTDVPNLDAVRLATLAFALFPPTFFLRMAYSEAVFALVLCVFLYAIECRRSLFLTLAAAGLCTAARPAGIAVLLPVWWFVYCRTGRGHRGLASACLYTPLAAWGLLAYMGFLWLSFGDPLAFAHSQYEWAMRPLEPPSIRLVRIATLEPIWSVYLENGPCYWRTLVPDIPAALNLQATNPVYFMISVLSIGLGAARRWLTASESLLAIGLLAVPYVTRSHEMCMGSQARFVSVVIPMYIVFGHALSKLPGPYVSLLFSVLSYFLGAYAALFAAGYVLV